VSGAGFSAGEVARRLGVAVTTLRTWHRRYGLGPSRHIPGQHRRYTDEDVSRLDVMRRLTGRGVPPAEAARVAVAPRRTPRVVGPRDGGGRAIPVGRSEPAARGLARAAMRLDAAAMREAIAASVGDVGVVRTWEALLCPVLIGIGERHAATGRLVEVEHLLSRCVSDVLGAQRPPANAAPARVLLACADDEQHTLPLEALAAALAERGHASRLLGARVPPAALLDAVRRTGPAVVVLWSHHPSTGDPAQLRAVLAARPRPLAVAAAGPGWGPAAALPDGVERPGDLPTALGLALGATEATTAAR
jgi:DNA-binding transcriptional MerR regulator